eukprot:TRINITY_DN103882_c0_g1_i1.p1 TRINITY_DN103882_c0_g1~~TRINITY_DN103882_c0_g1_i1.p1  ORF type:complete len:210 (+),score=29.40 TRINITY_DN103882_c0_g1_i1:73-630(+)
MDNMPGFADLPVTAVFGLYVTSAEPFVDTWNAGILTFLKDVWWQYGHRFIFTFNVYPYFDLTVQCNARYIEAATSFQNNGWVPSVVRGLRRRMQNIGAGAARLWLGEIGWSSPESPNVPAQVAGCEAFSSLDTFKKFYQGFLEWDLASAGVDHAFYFSIHDSVNFHLPEHFGLIEHCGSSECKIQ